jgi:hypothetical protein
MSTCPHEQILERLRAEYREMPGMRLRFEQVQRLCGIEQPLCKLALEALVEARFLRLGSDGAYVLFGSVSGIFGARGRSTPLKGV